MTTYDPELIDNLFHSIESVIIGIGKDDRVIFWNRYAENYFAITSEDALGKPFLEIGISWDWFQVSTNILNVLSDKYSSNRFNVTYVSAKEEYRELSISITAISSAMEPNNKQGYFIIANDVTQEHQLIKDTHRNLQYNSTTELFVSLAHEVNTPIQYINDNLSFIQTGLKEIHSAVNQIRGIISENNTEDSPLHKAVESVIESSDLEYFNKELESATKQSRAGMLEVFRIVDTISSYASLKDSKTSEVNINTLIQRIVFFTKSIWDNYATIEYNLDQTLKPTQIYALSFKETIHKIILHCVHAIEVNINDSIYNKGKILISTEQTNNTIAIKVCNDGTRLSDLDIDTLFDPIYSSIGRFSSEVSNLSSCKKVIEELHNGIIKVKRRDQGGTCLIVTLPNREQEE